MASPSGSSAATTAPKAISRTINVIGKDSASARCRSRNTVSLTALLIVASPVSAIWICGWAAAAACTAACTGGTRLAAVSPLPVIWNWSNAARCVGEIWFANLGSIGEWIWVTRPVAWIRASTSRIAAWKADELTRTVWLSKSTYSPACPGKSRLLICWA